MPVRNIDVYVRELRLTQEARIGALADTRLGIEGNNWLRQLLAGARDGEAAAVGGVPPALEAEMVKELQFFRANGITPVFVFSGLPVARRDGRAFAKEDHRPAYRQAAWEQYQQGHTEQALRGWGAAGPQTLANVVPFAMQVLAAHGAEFMRAPYSSWAQLAYLYRHEDQPIHAVYSSLDILMFDVDRVVTSISHARSTFAYVVREHLVSRCGVSSEQVLDMCLLAGCDWCPTFPALPSDIGFSFKSAVEATRQYRSGFGAIQAMADHVGVRAANYSDVYLRAYCTVRYHIVLCLDGTVAPLNAEAAPNDLHDIIGYRLPRAVYHLLARGAIHLPVATMLATGAWLEFAPADNGESDEYRRLATQWQSRVFGRQCALLCPGMGPFFQQRKVVLQAWFSPQTEIVLRDGAAAGRAEAEPTVLLRVPAAAATEAAAPLARVLAQGAGLVAAASIAGDAATSLLLWLLQSLGFVAAGGQATPAGMALGAGLRALPSHAAERLQWPVLVAAVLADQGLLTGAPWSVAYEDRQPLAGDAQRHACLLARIATLVPLTGRTGPWRLPFSRNLLGFSSAAKAVLRAAAGCADVALLALQSGSGGAAPELEPEALAGALTARRAMPLESTANAAAGLLVHALLAEHARGPGGWARVREQVGGGVGDARQALDDAWSVIGAVRAMGTVPGADAAQDWARAAFTEALGG